MQLVHAPVIVHSGPVCFQVLRMMVGVNISDEQLGSIADRTIQEADTNGDMSISFSEFIKVKYEQSFFYYYYSSMFSAHPGRSTARLHTQYHTAAVLKPKINPILHVNACVVIKDCYCLRREQQ